MSKNGGYAGVYKGRNQRLRDLSPDPTKEARKEAFVKLISACRPLHIIYGLTDALRLYEGQYCALIQIDPGADRLTVVAAGEHPDQAWLEKNAGRLIDSLPAFCRPGNEDGEPAAERMTIGTITEAASAKVIDEAPPFAEPVNTVAEMISAPAETPVRADRED